MSRFVADAPRFRVRDAAIAVRLVERARIGARLCFGALDEGSADIARACLAQVGRTERHLRDAIGSCHDDGMAVPALLERWHAEVRHLYHICSILVNDGREGS